MILQLIAALLGTVAFSVLYAVPRKHLILCGLIGACGWGLYLLCTQFLPFTPAGATFLASAAVMLSSRIAARLCRCPSTVFNLCGLFPLIPGGSFYRCIYALVIDDRAAARSAGTLAVKVIFALVIGVVLVQDLPEKWFQHKMH